MTHDSPRHLLELHARTHRRIRWLVALLTVSLLVVATQPLRAQDDAIVRVGVYNFEPLVFVDKDGTPKGLYLDALAYVAKREGWQIEYVPGTWAECLSRLEAGEIDLLPSIGYSEERAQKLDFTREHLFLDWAIVYRGKGQPIETILDLEGKKVAALKGSIYTQGLTKLLNQFDLHSQIVEKNEYTEVLAAVDRGEVEAGIITKVYGMVLEGRYSQIEATDTFFSPVKILFAVPKGKHAQILAALDRDFSALKADENSPYHAWLDKWIGIYQSRPVLPTSVIWGFVLALALLGFLASFNILLRRQVAHRTRELQADIAARTRTEESLRTSEEQFRAIASNTPDHILMQDRELRYVFVVNPQLGLTEADMIGKTDWDILGKADAENLTTIKRRVLETGEPFQLIAPVQNLNGETEFFEGAYIPRFDATGKTDGLIGYFRNITERKRAEAALRESEEKFKDVFESANVGKSITLPTGQVSANKAFADWLGYSRDELAKKTWQELTPPEDVETFQALLATLLRGEKDSVRFAKRYVHRNGLLLWADVSTTLRRDEAGQPLHFITTVVDITERKRAEDELRLSEERFANAFHASPAGMTITRIADGNFLDVNEAFCRMFEFSREEVIGHTSTELDMWSPEKRTILIEEQIRTGGLQNVELRAQARSGRIVNILFSSRPMELAGERHHITTMIDISERKRAQEQLTERHATLNAILESVSTPVFSLDRQYRYTSFNSVHAAIMKALYEAEIEIGKSMLEYQTVLDDRQTAQRNLDRALGGEQFIESAYSGEAGRTRRYFEISHNPIHEPDGNVIGVSVFARDFTERKRAEETLAERNYLLSESQRIAHIGSYIWDIATGNIQWSDECYRLYGVSPDSFVVTAEMGITSIYHEDQPKAQEWVSAHVAGVDPYPITYRTIWPDGSIHWLVTDGEMYRDDDGKPIKMIGTIQDITQHTLAEEALRQSEALIRAVMDNLPVGVAVNSADPDVVFEYMNDNFPVFYRTSREALETPDNFWNAVYEDPIFREEMRRRVLEDVATGEPERMQWENIPITRKGEKTTYISARNVQVPGKPLMISTVWDITERILVEQERQKFFLLVESSSEFIGMCDLDMQPLYVNPAGVRMVGLPDMAAACQVKVQDYFFPEDQAFIVDEFFPRVLREGHGDVEIRLRHFQTGQPLWFFYFLFSVQDASGEVIGWATVSHDITERKRAQEEHEKLQAQLTQAQKMESVGRLAGGVAHDFNNMLSIILGRTELLLMRAESGDRLRASLEDIQKAAQRSADLTRQLLAFSRKQTIAPKVLALNTTIEGMLKLLQRLIGENIDLAWMPGSNLWPVKMDPAQIDQILANLCVNARDAITGVGKITIETDNVVFDEKYCARHAGYVPGKFVLLAVSDDGCGMDAETISHLFEPFFTTKAMGKGTGLGLAIVYGVVKQNNGFVNVYSELGHGTSFKIYLPRHGEEAAWATEEPETQVEASGQETVLLVEDEPALLEMTKLMLEELGHPVLAAHTPGEAIRLAGVHSGRIDLLMTDVVMPEMNGRDLARNLQFLYPDIRLLFMSGYTADVIAHQGVLDPGVHFIQKPFSMSDMVVKIRAALENG